VPLVQAVSKKQRKTRLDDAPGRRINVIRNPHQLVFLGFRVEDAERRPGIVVPGLSYRAGVDQVYLPGVQGES